MPRTFFIAATLLAIGLWVLADEPPPAPTTIPELVKRLMSDDEKTWRDAVDQLGKLDVAAAPTELVKAKSDPNPLVRERADIAITALEKRITDRALARRRALLSRGAVDLFVASSTALKLETEDSRLWDPTFEFARTLAKKASYDRWPPSGSMQTFNDTTSFRRAVDPKFTRTDGAYILPEKDAKGKLLLRDPRVLAANGVTTQSGISWSVIVSKGSVSAGKGMGSSIVLCNGDVNTQDNLTEMVIVCDGDVFVNGIIADCLIVARGNITVKGKVGNSLLRAGGKIELEKGEFVPLENPLKERIIQNELNAFKYITFFELSRVGLEVTVKDKAVHIAKLAGTSPLSKAGIAVGDGVVKVNGTPVANAEELRRALRDAAATTGVATLTVTRDGKTTDIRVPLPE